MNKLLLLVVMAISISGCSSTHLMTVNSFGNSSNQNKTYTLLPKTESLEGLEFNEYSSYLHRALKDKGFVKSLMGLSDAGIVITADFYVKPRVVLTNGNIPTFGKTGIRSSHTTGSVNSGSVSISTTYTPSYGINGYAPAQFKHISYWRYLKLTAFSASDWKKGKTERKNELWATYVHSLGNSPDLRVIMPYLVLSISKYIGKSTGKVVEVKLDADDKRIQSLVSNLK